MSSDVSVAVVSGAAFTPGQIVYVNGGGTYSVHFVFSTTLTLTNLYSTNTAPGNTITSGKLVTAGGLKGDTGAAGTNGTNAFTTVANGFVVPSVGGTVNITPADFLTDHSWVGQGQTLYIETAGYFTWTHNPGFTIFSLTNTGAFGNANPGTMINPGVKVSPGGVPGNSPVTNTYFSASGFSNANLPAPSTTTLSGFVVTLGNTAFFDNSTGNPTSGIYTVPSDGIYWMAAQVDVVNTLSTMTLLDGSKLHIVKNSTNLVTADAVVGGEAGQTTNNKQTLVAFLPPRPFVTGDQVWFELDLPTNFSTVQSDLTSQIGIYRLA